MSATKSTKSTKKHATKKSARALNVQHAIMSNAGHLAWITTYQNRLKRTKSATARKEIKAKLALLAQHARKSATLRAKVAA